MCNAYASKLNPNVKQFDNKIERAIGVASYWQQRRNSGFPLDESKITSLVYTTLLYLDKHTELFERELRILNNRYFEMILKSRAF